MGGQMDDSTKHALSSRVLDTVYYFIHTSSLNPHSSVVG